MRRYSSFLMVLVLTGMSLHTGAQTVRDAMDAYNEAYKLYSTDKEATIAKFEKALEICNALGAAGDTTRLKIEGFLPGLYYEVANNAYKEKNYPEAVVKLKKAAEVAARYKSDDYLQSSTKLLGNTYYLMGNNAVNTNALDSAIFYYKTSIQTDPRAYKWFSLGQVYFKEKNEASMGAAMDKAIGLGKNENDSATVAKASTLCRQYFYAKAYGVQKNNPAKAIEYLDKTVAYDPAYANAYYMKSLLAYNLKRYQESADAAKLAIANEKDKEQIAKIYFKLGWTYVYLKDGPNACAAFRKASESKTYVNEARKNMINLKCN